MSLLFILYIETIVVRGSLQSIQKVANVLYLIHYLLLTQSGIKTIQYHRSVSDTLRP